MASHLSSGTDMTAMAVGDVKPHQSLCLLWGDSLRNIDARPDYDGPKMDVVLNSFTILGKRRGRGWLSSRNSIVVVLWLWLSSTTRNKLQDINDRQMQISTAVTRNNGHHLAILPSHSRSGTRQTRSSLWIWEPKADGSGAQRLGPRSSAPRNMRAFLPARRPFDPSPASIRARGTRQTLINSDSLPLTCRLVIMFPPVLIIRPSSASSP